MDDKFDEIVLTLFGHNIEFQQSTINWLILCVLPSIFSIWADKNLEKTGARKAPLGIFLIIEMTTGLCTSIIGDNLKHEMKHYLSFPGALIMMMVVSNLLGLLRLQSLTSSLSFNVTLTPVMFLTIQYNSIKEGGLGACLEGLTEPMWLFTPLNVISELKLPISLSMRLSGNILADSTIMLLVCTMMRSFLPFEVLGYIATLFLYAYFDVLSGLIQTHIFFMLASLFLNERVAPGEQQTMLTGGENYGIQ